MKYAVHPVMLVLALLAVIPSGSAESPYYQPKLLASGFYNPEGPVLDRDGNLYLVDLRKTGIYHITPDGEVTEIYNTGGNNNGAALDADGNLIIACTGKKAILRLDRQGVISVLAAVSDGDSLLGPNDMAWGGGGRLYFTDPGRSYYKNTYGGVHFIGRDGTAHRFAEGLAFPNGITCSPDGTYLYVGETKEHRILRYEMNPDGSAGGMTVFYELPEKHTPDGIKLDVEGNLWTTVHEYGELWQISPSGEKIHTVKLPSRMVSNLTFGGDGMKTIYATCPEDKRNPTGTVYMLSVPVAGLPVVPVE